MDYVYLILGIVLSIFVSTFFSFSETAVLSLNRSKLFAQVKSGDKRAKFLLSIVKNPEKILSPILLGNTLANVVTASLTSILISKLFVKEILGITHEVAQIIATLIITVLILIFGEITPKSIAARNPDKYAFSISYFLEFISKILYPLVWISLFFSSIVIKKFSRGGVAIHEEKKEKILSLLYKFNEKEIENSYDLMKNVVVLPDIKVKDIMVPISKVVAMDVNSSIDEILDVFVKTEYTRIPIYDGNIENVVGFILSKEFFKFYLAKKGIIPELDKASFESIINRPLFISEFSPIDLALNKIKNRKLHFAFVVGELGQVVGILTLEDILEEIVGDIYDEHDYNVLNMFEKKGDKFIFHENISIKDFNKLFPKKISENGDFTTLFGYLMDKYGDVPLKDTVLEDDNYIFKIKNSDNFGIKEVELEVKRNRDKFISEEESLK